MAVTQKVTLYNNKFTVPPVINAVQNDTDRQVEAYFGDFTLQVGMTGKLSFIRSDGTHYEASATLSTANNTATAELDQALTQAGVTQAQLKITDSGNVGSTFTFMIKVQPDVAGISVPQDGWSAQEFDQRLTDAENAIDAVEEDVADLQDKEYDYAPVITDTASGAIATFPDGADGVPVKDLQVSIEAVQSGSGDPSPDNVRPITGFSTAKVTRTGVNVWDEEWINGKFDLSTGNPISDSTTIRSKNGISVVGNTDYYVKNSGVSSQSAMIAFWYDLNNSFIRYDYCGNKVVTSPADAKYMQFYCGSAYGDTYNNDISVNYPSTDHDYHKGEVQTVTISLGDTRYGAHIDVTRGKMVVTHGYVVLNGSENWQVNSASSGLYYTIISGMNASGQAISNKYVQTDVAGASMVVGQMKLVSTYINFKTSFATVDAWKAELASNNVQVVYELATQIEVDLTPTEIKTLLGQNNVWADCGDIEVEYCADTKRYIQKLISALS